MDGATLSFDLAIFQFVIYVLMAPPSLLVLYRHGLYGLPGWLFLEAFILLQLVAAGLNIHTGKDATSSTGALISQVGLSPLLLAVEGVLAEIYRTSQETSFFYKPIVSIAYHLIVVGAAVLVGVGSGSLYSSHPSSSAAGEVKGGVLVFLIVWAYLVFLGVKALCRLRKLKAFRWLLVSVLLAIPALLVRIIFSILSVFDTKANKFSPISGNVAIRVIMEVLPVMLTAFALTAGGILTIRASTGWKNALQ